LSTGAYLPARAGRRDPHGAGGSPLSRSRQAGPTGTQKISYPSLRATAKNAAATFGYLRYATGTFKVGLTRELEERVRTIVDAIRAGRSAATVNRSHSIVQRCVSCSVREQCNEALG
jgi:hypothetical protein